MSFSKCCQLGPLTCPSRPQAAILQQTAEYIFSLEQEKTRLLQQNTQLKRFIQVAPAEASRHLNTCPPPGLLLLAWACLGSNTARDSHEAAGLTFPTDTPTSGTCLPAQASVNPSIKCS